MNQEEFEQAFDRLTPRRKEVLRRILAGETDDAIAKSLVIGEATVRKHIERICQVFGLENKHPDERRYKRFEVAKLVAKYKPELLSDRTPVTMNEVAVAETASTKDTSDSDTVVTEIPQSAKLAGQLQVESDIVWQLPAMPQHDRELILERLNQPASDEQKRKQIAKDFNKIGYERYLDGDFKSAATYLELAIAFDPNLGQGYFNLGSTYEKLEELDRACENYKIATNYRNRAAYAAISNLARLEILEGNSAAAIDRLLPSLEEVKDTTVKSSLHKNLGWAYLDRKQYLNAEDHLRKAIKLDSERAAAYCLLAQVQEAQGDKQSALTSWENCLKYDSRDKKPKAAAWRSPELNVWQMQARERLKALDN